MAEKVNFMPLELSVASTEQLLTDCEHKLLLGRADFESILIDDENEPDNLPSLFNTIEVSQLLQEQRRYARQILTTFYAMAFCILIYTIAHTGAIIFMHYCGN